MLCTTCAIYYAAIIRVHSPHAVKLFLLWALIDFCLEYASLPCMIGINYFFFFFRENGARWKRKWVNDDSVFLAMQVRTHAMSGSSHKQIGKEGGEIDWLTLWDAARQKFSPCSKRATIELPGASAATAASATQIELTSFMPSYFIG